MKTLPLLLSLSTMLLAQDLGTITVEDNADATPYQGFEGIFNPPEVLEFENDIAGAAAQKVLTPSEATFIPGVQGDPIKAIKTLGGVTATGDVSGELYIYASKPEESITTINHMPIGYLYHTYGLHSVIAPDAIDQINAYLAGFDVTYGNALGGVIDVTPRYPTGETSGYAHMGIYDASAGIDTALSDNVAFYLGARRSYFDLLAPKTGTLSEEAELTYTQFPNYWDLTFMMTYQADSDNLFSFETISAADALTIDTQENDVKDPLATGTIDNDRSFTSLGLRHQGFYGGYRSHTLASYMRSSSKTELFDGYEVDALSDTLGLFHQSTYDLGNHRLIAGTEINRYITPLDLNISRPPTADDYDYDFTTATKYLIDDTYVINTGALFVEDIYRMEDDWTLRYGVRTSTTDYGNLKSTFDPRASLVYTFDNDAHLSVSGGRYTQIPQSTKIIKEMGNPALDFERAWHLVLHGDHPLGDGGSIEIEPFYKRFENLAIDTNQSRNDGNPLNFIGGGEGYAYGFDMSAKIREGNWYLYGAYTYIRSKRQLRAEDGTKYRFFAEVPHTLQLLGSYRFNRNWAFSTFMKYHSGRPYTPIEGTYIDDGRVRPIYGTPYSDRLDDYFTLNLKIAQNIRLGSGETLEWSFELMNATNHNNVSDIQYDDNYNKEGTFSQLPLLPWFDVTLRF